MRSSQSANISATHSVGQPESESGTVFESRGCLKACRTLSASGMARLPVPQPQSQTLTSTTPPSSASQLSTLSTVCAWPMRMSSCTCGLHGSGALDFEIWGTLEVLSLRVKIGSWRSWVQKDSWVESSVFTVPRLKA
jgi:hypothetical protein